MRSNGRGSSLVVLWVALAVAGAAALALLLQRRGSEPCFDRVRPAHAARAVTSIVSEGREIRVRGPDGEQRAPRGAQRIVSTLPGVTEVVAALGGLDRLVAVSPWCDTPDAVRDLPRVGVLPLDVEAVLSHEPDLVVTDRRLLRRDLDALRGRGISVLALETSRSLADLADAIDVLAHALDTPHARAFAADWRQDLGVVLREAERTVRTPPPRVLVVSQWDPLHAICEGALLDDMLRILGCANVACDLGDVASGPFSEELVFERQPEWILSTSGPMPASLAERWNVVPAVVSGKVAVATSPDLVRAGPASLSGFRRLTGLLAGTIPADRLSPEEPGEGR
jgi:iron complex transport system substrate-binding protein